MVLEQLIVGARRDRIQPLQPARQTLFFEMIRDGNNLAEIQREFGLPKEPGDTKNVPFSELPKNA